MLAEARAAIDLDGFRSLDRHADHAAGWAKSDALNQLTWIVIRKSGLVPDTTVETDLLARRERAGPKAGKARSKASTSPSPSCAPNAMTGIRRQADGPRCRGRLCR